MNDSTGKPSSESDEAFFSRLFIAELRKYGRVNYRRLFAAMRGRLPEPATERAQEFAMFMRSKLRLFPSKVRDPKAIEGILKDVERGREEAK